MTEILGRKIVMEQVVSLSEHPANPRQGDLGALVETITENGYIVPVVAQTSSRYVIDGNHRLKAARQLGMTEIPVVWVDVDDDRALRHLLAANRLNDLAMYEDSALVALLTDLAQSTSEGLAGSGWDGDALDQLLADLATPVVGPPEPNGAQPPEADDEITCPACGAQFTLGVERSLLSRAFRASGR